MTGEDEHCDEARTPVTSQRARNEVDAKLGLRVTSLRLAAGLTATELANYVGLNEKDILDIERGERRPRARVLVAMAHALNCNVASFFAYD